MGCETGIIGGVEVPIPTNECACVGVRNIVFNPSAGTFTVTLTDGTTYTSPDLRGSIGLTGMAGINGLDGTNGRDVEMFYDVPTRTIQWRLVGSLVWLNLYTFPLNEAWKTIRGTMPSDALIDGTIINGYTAGSGASAMSFFYIRKKSNGDVEINIDSLDLLKNSTNINIVTLPVAYRPIYTVSTMINYMQTIPKICMFNINDNGVVSVNTRDGSLFGTSTILINGSITYSTI